MIRRQALSPLAIIEGFGENMGLFTSCTMVFYLDLRKQDELSPVRENFHILSTIKSSAEV